MNVNDYAERIVRNFMLDLTDHVFLHIQHDEELMRGYQTMINENSLRSVNQAIGRKIKEVFDLKNGEICSKPKSWLIKDYTRHTK